MRLKASTSDVQKEKGEEPGPPTGGPPIPEMSIDRAWATRSMPSRVPAGTFGIAMDAENAPLMSAWPTAAGTIAPGASVRGVGIIGGTPPTLTSSLVNQGSIVSDQPGQLLTCNAPDFDNQGTVHAAGGSVVVSVALALSLGARTYVANLIGGHHLRHSFSVGQTVRMGGFEGRILDLTPVAVVLETEEGRVTLPAKVYGEEAIVLRIGEKA